VYCPTNPHEKAMQRALIQYRNPKNRALVIEALHKAGREDLIGYGPKCLVRPDKPAKGGRPGKPGKPKGRSKPQSRKARPNSQEASGNRGSRPDNGNRRRKH
jgi:hypothetical protein